MNSHTYTKIDDIFTDLRKLIDKKIAFSFHHNTASEISHEGLMLFVKPGSYQAAKKALPKIFKETKAPKYDGLTVYLKVETEESKARDKARKKGEEEAAARKAAQPSMDNLKAKIAAAKAAKEEAKSKTGRKKR